MRSFLFVPADSDRKLEKSFSSGADALLIDLEDSVALSHKPQARDRAAAFLRAQVATVDRPRLVVRVNSLSSGLIDDDLKAIVGARPDAILLPKAEGATSVVHAAAKLATHEALHGLAEGHVRIIAIATETAAALFLAGTYRGASPRLTGLTWVRRPVGRTWRRSQPRSNGSFSRSLPAGAHALPCGRLIGTGATDRHSVCGLPGRSGPEARKRGSPAGRLHG